MTGSCVLRETILRVVCGWSARIYVYPSIYPDRVSGCEVRPCVFREREREREEREALYLSSVFTKKTVQRSRASFRYYTINLSIHLSIYLSASSEVPLRR